MMLMVVMVMINVMMMVMVMVNDRGSDQTSCKKMGNVWGIEGVLDGMECASIFDGTVGDFVKPENAR